MRVEVVTAVRVWVVWLGYGGAGGVRGWIAEKRGKVVFSRSLFLSLYEKIMV